MLFTYKKYNIYNISTYLQSYITYFFLCFIDLTVLFLLTLSWTEICLVFFPAFFLLLVVAVVVAFLLLLLVEVVATAFPLLLLVEVVVAAAFFLLLLAEVVAAAFLLLLLFEGCGIGPLVSRSLK